MFLGEDRHSGERCAVKILHPHLTERPGQAAAARRAATARASGGGQACGRPPSGAASVPGSSMASDAVDGLDSLRHAARRKSRAASTQGSDLLPKSLPQATGSSGQQRHRAGSVRAQVRERVAVRRRQSGLRSLLSGVRADLPRAACHRERTMIDQDVVVNYAGPLPRPHSGWRIVRTGTLLARTTRSATLPATRWRIPVRPCVPMTTRSALW